MDETLDGELPPGTRDALCSDPDVVFVVLFGSRAGGRPRASSDVDVAVKFVDDLSRTERFRKRCRLSATVQDSNTPFVDLSDVDALPLPVAHAAVGGRFVCGDRHAFETFKTTVEGQFDAERAAIERRQRKLIQRIAEEGLHG